MGITHKIDTIDSDDTDIEFIYQGVSYYKDNETTKVTVEWTLDEFEMEGVKMYIAEIDKVDTEIMIEDENFTLHLKQVFDYCKSKWKINVVGIDTPSDREPIYPLATVFNMDKQTIDVIFDKYS